MGFLDVSHWDSSALTTLGIAAIIGLYLGFAARKITLPSLIGYLVLGVLLGPSFLHLLTESQLEDLSFVTSIALGFVAFTIGSELSVASLRRLGAGIVSIIIAESLGAFLVVTFAVFAVTQDWVMALLFGALAPASAPAGTVAVIQETRSKGTLTKALYAVVGFDDGLAIVIFGFAMAAAKAVLLSQTPEADSAGLMESMLTPAVEIVLSLVLGAVIGFGFCQLARFLTQPSELIIIVFGAVLLASGLSMRWNLSLILTNMVVGFVLVNTRRESFVHRVTGSVSSVMPLLFVLFFSLAGAHLKIGALPELGLIGATYILARSAGKIAGARAGASIWPVEDKIKKYLGIGILSQAGVAIGLSLIVNQQLTRLAEQYEGLDRAAALGANILTTITATCIVFEIAGPIGAKIALAKAGEIGAEKPRAGTQAARRAGRKAGRD